MAVTRNTKSNRLLNGTSKADTILNGYWLDDVLYKGGSNVTINAGKGNDYIQLYECAKVSVSAGAGNDSILGGRRVKQTTVDCGAGNDYVDQFIWQSSISGGAGNDFLNIKGFVVTVTGGAGNDSIALHSTDNLIQYKSGDGNDTITGFNSTDTLTISGGSYSTTASGNDVIVKVGKGKITLKDVKGNAVNINGKNVGGNSTNSKFIQLTSGDDLLANNLSNVTISGLAGNDEIQNDVEDINYVSISGGAGDDSIWNWGGNYSTLNGGSGNDYIYSDGENVLFEYKTGDGNDLIEGFLADSTLSIAGSSYSSKKSGSDVIVTVGKGKISLIGAANLSKVNIKGTKSGGSSSSTTVTVTDKTKSPVTVDSSVKIIDASARTTAVSIKGNGLANSIVGGKGNDSLYGRAGDDTILGGAGNDKLYGSNGNDVLKGGAGNDSLWGDANNDSLWGGAGNDTFIFKAGDGTNTIFDYASGEVLKILNEDGSSGGKFTKSAFSSGILSLTISGGGQIILNNVSKSDNFKINNTIYKISGSKLVSK